MSIYGQLIDESVLYESDKSYSLNEHFDLLSEGKILDGIKNAIEKLSFSKGNKEAEKAEAEIKADIIDSGKDIPEIAYHHEGFFDFLDPNKAKAGKYKLNVLGQSNNGNMAYSCDNIKIQGVPVIMFSKPYYPIAKNEALVRAIDSIASIINKNFTDYLSISIARKIDGNEDGAEKYVPNKINAKVQWAQASADDDKDRGPVIYTLIGISTNIKDYEKGSLITMYSPKESALYTMFEKEHE